MTLTHLYRLAALSRDLDVPVTTLRSAADRGDLQTVTTGCGLRLATKRDAERFLANTPGRGRPRKTT